MGPLKCTNCGKTLTSKSYKDCVYCHNCLNILMTHENKAYDRMFYELCRYERIAPSIEEE